MMSRVRHRALVQGVSWAVLLVCCAAPASAPAKDYFLTIGGGYEPTSNQISLERNVIFFQQILNDRSVPDEQRAVLFSDGDDPARDIQYRDPQAKIPDAVRILAEVLADEDELNLRYRNHEVPQVTSSARSLALRRQVSDLAKRAKAGDRVIIYVTGHGGESEDDNAHNCVLHLWEDDQITSAEFARMLDRLPQEVTVIMVMVQCYSGGFAHTLFDRADAELGLSRQVRCGFFSQLHDRVAAGCTPDVDEENYQEYSSFFWAALAGKNRTGKPIEQVDYDGDGKTSFAEAHAYAVIASDTVDIPLRSSDELLERYSRLAKVQDDDAIEEEVEEPSALSQIFRGLRKDEPHDPPLAKLLPLAGTLDELAELAAPVDRAILQQLAQQLEIAGDTDMADLRKQVAAKKRAMKRAEEKFGESAMRYLMVRSEFRDVLHQRWPELEATISPTLASLLTESAAEVEQFVTPQNDYRVLIKARDRMREQRDASMDADRREAKHRRLLRIARRIVLAKNLSRVAAPEIVEHYARLTAAEAQGLDPPTE